MTSIINMQRNKATPLTRTNRCQCEGDLQEILGIVSGSADQKMKSTYGSLRKRTCSINE